MSALHARVAEHTIEPALVNDFLTSNVYPRDLVFETEAPGHFILVGASDRPGDWIARLSTLWSNEHGSSSSEGPILLAIEQVFSATLPVENPNQTIEDLATIIQGAKILA